jgi:hypothetical protein
MQTDNTLLRRLPSTLLLLLVIGALTIQQGASTGSITVISVTPTSTSPIITTSPVSLNVVYVNSSDNSIWAGDVETYFYVRAPADTFRYAGHSGGTGGHASRSYAPPVAGTYAWYVIATLLPGETNVTFPADAPSHPWTFSCGITTVTAISTQYSWTTQTVIVGMVTTYSYVYYTQSQYVTVYRTQTVSVTSTNRVYSTVSTTSTGYKTTQTLPITLSQTSTTTQVSYSPVTITSYVYIESYVNTTASAPTTTQGNSSRPWDFLSALTQLPSFASIPGYLIVLGSTCAAAAGAAVYVGTRSLSARRRAKRPSSPETVQDMDQTVLDYITSHDGNISMKKASEDLNLPTDSIAAIIQGLKQAGKLNTT